MHTRNTQKLFLSHDKGPYLFILSQKKTSQFLHFMVFISNVFNDNHHETYLFSCPCGISEDTSS